jgi:hypothetical protein
MGAVLGLIALGVLLIAYGVLSPRAAAIAPAITGMPMVGDTRGGSDPLARPVPGSDTVEAGDATPRLLLRCEPGQRAVIQHLAGAAQAECTDAWPSDDRYGTTRIPVAYRASYRRLRRLDRDPTPYRTRPVRVVRPSGRDWGKTALVIGGTTAAGAALGAIFGGQKGTLIGAAIGGGASSLYEALKR